MYQPKCYNSKSNIIYRLNSSKTVIILSVIQSNYALRIFSCTVTAWINLNLSYTNLQTSGNVLNVFNEDDLLSYKGGNITFYPRVEFLPTFSPMKPWDVIDGTQIDTERLKSNANIVFFSWCHLNSGKISLANVIRQRHRRNKAMSLEGGDKNRSDIPHSYFLELIPLITNKQ